MPKTSLLTGDLKSAVIMQRKIKGLPVTLSPQPNGLSPESVESVKGEKAKPTESKAVESLPPPKPIERHDRMRVRNFVMNHLG